MGLRFQKRIRLFKGLTLNPAHPTSISAASSDGGRFLFWVISGMSKYLAYSDQSHSACT